MHNEDTPPIGNTTAMVKEDNEDVIMQDISHGTVEPANDQELEKQKTVEGEMYFHRLGWKRLTIILIVQSVALGSLGLPAAFASLGMTLGLLLTVFIGLVSMYASYNIGQVKLKFPHVAHYVDIGTLLIGKFGTVLVSFFFVSLVVLTIGSHCLTGQIALETITQSTETCALAFGIASAAILFLLAIPPSFTEIAILGYVDFASIILAIGVTMIATGIQKSERTSSTWSAWPKKDLTLSEAFVAVDNIVFAFGFASSQPSFMAEMHAPKDYIKSIRVLCAVEIIIYSLTGAVIYYIVGNDVKSPALLSAGSTVSRVVFGIALPVIFISGSINTTAVSKYIHGHIFRNSVTRYVNTKKEWATWIGLVGFLTVIAWVIAEAIPFFSELLSICSALFLSGLCFYLPALMWFLLLKEGPWYARHNLRTAFYNTIVFTVGVAVLGCGIYGSIVELIHHFDSGSISGPFSCS